MVLMEYNSQEHKLHNVEPPSKEADPRTCHVCVFGGLCIWVAVSNHPFRVHDDDDDGLEKAPRTTAAGRGRCHLTSVRQTDEEHVSFC